MTTWQRFGDGTWVNVDQLEVVRVEEQEGGGWQLTAAFTSGRTHPLGSHDDRDLLIDCTDALLRGEVGRHLGALAGAGDTPVVPEVPDVQVAATRRRVWRFWRSEVVPSMHAAEAHPDQVELQPAG